MYLSSLNTPVRTRGGVLNRRYCGMAIPFRRHHHNPAAVVAQAGEDEEAPRSILEFSAKLEKAVQATATRSKEVAAAKKEHAPFLSQSTNESRRRSARRTGAGHELR